MVSSPSEAGTSHAAQDAEPLQPFAEISKARRHAELAENIAAIAAGLSNAVSIRLQESKLTIKSLGDCNALLLKECNEQALFAAGLGTVSQDLRQRMSEMPKIFEELFEMDARVRSLVTALDDLEASTTRLEQSVPTPKAKSSATMCNARRFFTMEYPKAWTGQVQAPPDTPE